MRTEQIPAVLAYGQRGLGCLFGRNSTCSSCLAQAWVHNDLELTAFIPIQGSTQHSSQDFVPVSRPVLTSQVPSLGCGIQSSQDCLHTETREGCQQSGVIYEKDLPSSVC